MASSSDNQTPSLGRTNSVDVSQGQCWICYLDASETPNQRWVNACPCTLEAHETCLLEWITREEHDGRSKDGKLKCPQCKATITTQEPYDAIFALRNRLHRKFSRMAPGILAGTFAAGSVAGSAWYGYHAFAMFAGHRRADRWVFGWGFRGMTASVMLKLLGLSFIGPSIVIARMIPRIEYLVIPFSWVYAGSLIHREPILAWPPSPEWVVTLLPVIHMAYCRLYRKFFGPLERRINKTLRGGNLDNLFAGAEGDAAAEAAAAANDAPARREPGFFANALDMANAVMGLFNGHGEEEAEIELQVRIDAVNDDADNGDGEGVDDDEADPAIVVDRDDHEEAAAAAAPPPPAIPAAAAAAPAPAQQQPQQQNQNRRDRQQQNEVVWPTLTDVLNNMAISLALPMISWQMGNLIRLALKVTGPHLLAASGAAGKNGSSSWRWYSSAGNSPNNKSLLQYRWGRSLVGGFLFIVLKDAFVLYAKYRGAEAKKNRRIKEVPKRNRGRNGGSSPSTTTPPAGSS